MKSAVLLFIKSKGSTGSGVWRYCEILRVITVSRLYLQVQIALLLLVSPHQ